jgi:hypothetical protein
MCLSRGREGEAMPRLSKLLAVTFGVALAGCTSAQPIMTPDGRPGYTIECSERLLSWEDCFERADEICGGRNYDVFTRAGEQSPLVAAEPAHLSSNTTARRSMVIACKR